jgi:hypothetical protein
VTNAVVAGAVAIKLANGGEAWVRLSWALGFRKLGSHLPVGDGLLTFRTPAEAVAGERSIAGDYETHVRAARRIAEEYFGSDNVLADFVERALA